MPNVSADTAGAIVSLATSQDDRFPADNIIDGNEATFWPTTGMFPQEFIITFPSSTRIKSIKTWTCDIKDVRIEYSASEKPQQFEMLMELELDHVSDRLQVKENRFQSVVARHVKFVIMAAYEDFCSVHRLNIDGEPSGDRD
eukprot:Opistho-2@67471